MESVLEEIANSNNKNATNNILGLNEKSLDFYDRNKNIEFKNATLLSYMVMIRIILACFGVTMIAIAIYFLIESPIEFIIISFSALFLCLITILLSYVLVLRKRIQIMIIIDFAILIVLSGFVGYLYNDSAEAFVALFMIACFQWNRYRVLFSGIVCFIFPILITIIDGIRKDITILRHFEIIGKWLCFIIFFFFSTFIEEKYSKRQFLKQTKLKKEFKKSKNILNILLPNFVRERVRTGQRFIAEDQGVVTIIFIDFVDFDNIVSMHSPGELIEFLDKIYNAFDQMWNLHSLQKIETVGKSYMACGGLKAIEKNYKKNRAIKHHTIRILNFAFESVEYIKKRTLKNGQPLAVKIGIHTGKVISGVVGQHKPQFSLVGDTVNRTSRMCSKWDYNRIHMTEDTQKYLKHLPDLKFESQQTEAKGLGVITTYYVSKKRTVHRAQNDNMQSVEDLENEEEKASHESELFADSDDSKMKKILNDDNEPRNNDLRNNELQAPNTGKTPAENFEQSMIMEREASENGQNNDGEKNNNIVFEIPKYLIWTKKKNRKYESYIFKKNVENYRLFFNISCVLVSLTLAVTEVSIFSDSHGLQTEKIVYLICNGIMIFMSLIMLYLSTQLTRKSPAPIILSIYFYYIVAFVYSVFVEIDHRENRTDKINYLFIVLFMWAYTSHLRVLMFKHMIIFYIMSIVGWIIIKIVYPKESIVQTLFLVYIIVSTMINHYSAEKSFRISFNYERDLNHEIKRTQALLRNLVPPNVFRGLLKGKRIADHIQNVTLLYTDMCGFTAFSKSREPKEVVELLSKLFQRMDNLCIKNNVYKVHTIGDCYVVSGYTGKVSNEKRDIYQEAVNVIETGFDMLDIIRDVREELDIKELDMRIGIHTGMMTAGIIGSNIVMWVIINKDNV